MAAADRWRTGLAGERTLLFASALAVGVGGVILSFLGNPRNSGICVSCFLENIAGALGFHADERMQYLRPEVGGFLLGSFLSSLLGRQFQPRGGSATLLRMAAGFFIIVGCAVFIGCPIKMVLRLGAGDLSALAGLGGLAGGVAAGILFLRRGFDLGRTEPQPPVAGYLAPAAGLLLVLAVVAPPPFVGRSLSGPGAMHPVWWVSLAAGLAIGALAQRSRFCVTGLLRNAMLIRDGGALLALALFLAAAGAASAATGQFHPGLLDQPGSHPDHLWNFLACFLVGLGAVVADGCPFRQLILSGEGNLDAGATLTGMLLAGGAVYNWGIRSTTSGPTTVGKVAVLLGLAILLATANACRRRA